ncbi:MAG TPA: hypothetical protein DIS81_10785 [Psychrobacter sp.]|nr:hypothetical protein [Psychrobacter sp.]
MGYQPILLIVWIKAIDVISVFVPLVSHTIEFFILYYFQTRRLYTYPKNTSTRKVSISLSKSIICFIQLLISQIKKGSFTMDNISGDRQFR